MNIALWIVATLFGVAFTIGGIVKLSWSHEKAVRVFTWPQDFTPGTIKAIGVVELVGGLGLWVPAVLDIAPILVPVAASGMALYMAGAGTERLRRLEYKELVGDLMFLAAMVFVAWGRFDQVPFT